jgi:hypothetical protein
MKEILSSYLAELDREFVIKLSKIVKNYLKKLNLLNKNVSIFKVSYLRRRTHKIHLNYI